MQLLVPAYQKYITPLHRLFAKGLGVICFLLLMTNNSHANQLDFRTFSKGQSTVFDYTWRHQDRTYQLNFDIQNELLDKMPRSPARYNKKVFQDTVYNKVMAVAKKIDPTLAKISIRKNRTGLSFNVSSRVESKAQEVLDILSEAHNKAEKDYWQDNFFTQYESPTGASAIRHDHAKYSQQSSAALQTIVDKIKAMQQNSYDVREFIQIAMSWIQSIPYNELEDRLSSNGAGFVSPKDLLLQNQGDCDSKSTLMAALLRAYNERLKVKMVYLPNHALLAVGINPEPGETTISQANNRFVLIEPTGPAQLAIGEVDKSTKMAIRNRQFTTNYL